MIRPPRIITIDPVHVAADIFSWNTNRPNNGLIRAKTPTGKETVLAKSFPNDGVTADLQKGRAKKDKPSPICHW
jgi:hypothetical protein